MEELLEAARVDSAIMLVVGDLGYGVVDRFARELPNQFLNAGIAEQNMLGLSAGIAASGFKVFVYSIANFPTLRALEQVRNDICYHNLDVTIVSVGAGVAYGSLGYSHHAVEDISIMRSLPNLRIISPSDSLEVRATVREVIARGGPTLMRLGKSDQTTIHSQIPEVLGWPHLIREGQDVTILGTGEIVRECMNAADMLSEVGVSAGVICCPTICPIDLGWAKGLGTEIPVVTVEEHVLAGGFGSAILEALNACSSRPPVLRIGIEEVLKPTIGSSDYIRSAHGLDGQTIAKRILGWIKTAT